MSKVSRSRVKTKALEHILFGNQNNEPDVVYYREAGSGTFDDFIRVVNGNRYKYRRARIWLENSKGIKVRKVFYALTDAELRRKIKEAKTKPASTVNPEKTTLAQYFDLWVQTRSNLRPKTIKDYKFNFDKHLRDRIGKAKLSRLTPDHFRALFKELTDDEIGARTRKLSYQVLHAALNRLLKDRTLTHNPLSAVEEPRVPKPIIPIATLEQTQKLLAAAKESPYYALILLAILTGMRPGELFGLQWDDVHLDSGWLWVCRALNKDTQGKLTLDEPKNKSSIRRVDLDARLVNALKEHRRANPAPGFVFTGPEGRPIWADTFRARIWYPLLEKAKIPRLTLYSFRHFGNSLLAEQGTNLKVLQSRLGHKTMDQTLNTYLHLMPGATKAAADAISSLVFSNGSENSKRRNSSGLNRSKNGAKKEIAK